MASLALDSKMHAELIEDGARIGQHVHEVRDGRALIAADVTDARLQQRLGDGEDGLALEGLARRELQRLHFRREGSFGHDRLCRCPH